MHSLVQVISVSLLLARTGAQKTTDRYYSEDPPPDNGSPLFALDRYDGGGHQPFYPGEPAPNGYQFSSFRGPVSGRIKEIEVPYAAPPGVPGQYQQRANGPPAMTFDYIAKPDYAFTFGLHDPESGNAQKQYEARDGDTVRGEYSFVEPDGTLRTVTYSADPKNGFQADVKYGPSGLPPPPPPTPSPSPGYTGPRARSANPNRLRNQRPAYSSYEDEY